MAIIKQSKQRNAIKEFLMTRTDHPTADMVYENIKKTFPNISLGTVYRNLSLLTELGEIQKISIGNEPDRFDGTVGSHNHFVCTECHQVIDLKMEKIDHITLMAGQHFEGKVTGHVTYFYGICGECMKNHYS